MAKRRSKNESGLGETGSIEEIVPKLERDLIWHARIGWGIAGLFAVVLGWLLIYYLPEQFKDKLPENLRGSFAQLQQGVSDIQKRVERIEDRYEKLTPTC